MNLDLDKYSQCHKCGFRTEKNKNGTTSYFYKCEIHGKQETAHYYNVPTDLGLELLNFLNSRWDKEKQEFKTGEI